MKKAVFILILALNAGSVPAQSQTTSQLTKQQQLAIESTIQEEMMVSGTPGASVAIINNNKIVYEKWFGKANTQTETSLNDATIFQIGSVTKIFTSLALLTELKHAGISVHSPIGELVRDLSPGLAKLTYHQLLSHTSGMIDYWPAPNECSLDPYTFFKDKGDSILFARPGEVFSYCNIAYSLAGLALEKLTNKPYPEAINDIILKPLKLNNTTFDFLTVACKSFSAGHVLDRSNGSVMTYILNVSCPLIQAAGGLYSNTPDLERFAITLMNQGEIDGQQIFEKSVIEMLSGKYSARFTSSDSPFSFLSFPNNAYGYGIFTFDYGNLKFTGNIGIASQMTYFMYVPEKKFALIILSNLQMDMLVSSFKKILDVVLGETEKPAARIEFDQKESKAITGSYLFHAFDYRNEFSADIAEKNGRLFINLPGEGETELFRTGVMEYTFISQASRLPGEILFEKDKSGVINYMRYSWASWQKIR